MNQRVRIKGMNSPIITYRTIAKDANVSVSTIKKIMAGYRRASVKMATRLEEVTGIPAEAWVLPEKFDLRKRYQELKERMERS